MALKKRKLGVGIVALGVLAVAIAGIALWKPALRAWYAWQLESPEVAIEEKWRIVERALRVGGERDVEEWCLIQLRSPDREHQLWVAATLAEVGSERTVLPLLRLVEPVKKKSSSRQDGLIFAGEPLADYPDWRLNWFLSHFGHADGIGKSRAWRTRELIARNQEILSQLELIRTVMRGIGLRAVMVLGAIESDASHPDVLRQLANLELHAVLWQAPSGPEDVETLTRAVRTAPDPEVRMYVAQALGRIGLEALSAREALTAALQDEIHYVRNTAERALVRIDQAIARAGKTPSGN